MKRLWSALERALARRREAPRAGDGGGMIGADLAAVRRTSDFFGFFNLEPTGRETAEGVEFRPSGEAFRALVRLLVKVDGQGRIRAMALTLRRSFVDDPANSVFACDIAKSFLRDAPGPSGAARLQALADDIESTNAPFGRPGHRPTTKGYAVYAGADRAETLDLGAARFSIAPSTDDGAPALVLSLSAQ